jgi:hypothetical protein
VAKCPDKGARKLTKAVRQSRIAASVSPYDFPNCVRTVEAAANSAAFQNQSNAWIEPLQQH